MTRCGHRLRAALSRSTPSACRRSGTARSCCCRSPTRSETPGPHRRAKA
jgi:hypothetical protein